MPDLVPLRRALLSVSDKTGLIPLARDLVSHGVEIVSTGGTADALSGEGLSVIRVEDLTGFPEMMGGRVKTLHPVVHGAVLARRDVEEDERALREHEITPIDLVCVNLYPFAATVDNPDVTTAEALEQIDIGGPTLLRAAAKNHPSVTVLTSPDDYPTLREEIRTHGGATTLEFRRRLAAEAFRRVAAYDATITAWLSSAPVPPAAASYTDRHPLRYGETPHQQAALYVDRLGRGPSVARARVLHGKPLSYNNIQDAAAALELVQDMQRVAGRPGCTIIKHTNPCGAGTAPTLAEAFDLAYDGDPRAAYGGILAASRPIDGATATRICDGQKFLEVVVAPEFDDGVAERLGSRWTNVRLLAVGDLQTPDPREETFRSIPGGMLVQQRDAAVPDPRTWRHVAGPKPTEAMLADAAFTWIIVKHLKSNAVALARGGQMLGGGCGQVDRVTACRLAVEKAGDRIDRATVAASDAFFPFPDGPQLLVDAGVGCIVHPGGSKRDSETEAVCDKHGVTCLHTGIRHFRH